MRILTFVSAACAVVASTVGDVTYRGCARFGAN
jgi:hypothetical protein